MKFSNEVALVTGASSGIGFEAARLFLEAGCRVAASVRNDEAEEKLRTISPEIQAIRLDVSSEEQWDNAISQIEERFGGVDILFNNAGVTLTGELLETDLELWHKVININLTSVFLGCRAVARGMLDRGSGAIVNNASINAIRGNYGLVAYSASKGGIAAMTRSIALDYAGRNIRVNCLCPATIDTRMVHEYLAASEDPEATLAAMVAKHPIGRIANAEEVASVAVFLASSDASFITGQTIPIDGGRSIR